MAVTVSNYARRVKLTTTETVTTLTGYVALITEANLPAEIFTLAQDGGGDIRIAENSDGTSQLPVEIVDFNTTANTAVIWTRVPAFATSYELWIFYDSTIGAQSPEANTALYGRNNVWQDYAGVWHGKDLSDSTGNGYTLTNVNGVTFSTDSPTGFAFDLGTTGYLTVSSSLSELEGASALTLTQWSKPTGLGGATSDRNTAQSSYVTSGNNRAYALYYRSNDTDFFTSANGSATQFNNWDTIGQVVQDSYFHAAVTYDSTVNSGIPYLRINGSAPNSHTTQESITTLKTAQAAHWVGSVEFSPSRDHQGLISEVRASSNYFPTAHLDTEYSNQNNPATFWTTGTPENTVQDGIDPTLWGKRVKLTTTTTVATLTGYVGLVTGSNLPSEIWTLSEDGGGDLRACLNSDGTSQLPLEVVNHNTTAQESVLWIRFPTFATNTEFWLFYDKTGEVQPAVTDTYGRNNVWQDYGIVIHGGGSDAIDSTGEHTLALTGTATSSSGFISTAMVTSQNNYYSATPTARYQSMTSGSYTMQASHLFTTAFFDGNTSILAQQAASSSPSLEFSQTDNTRLITRDSATLTRVATSNSAFDIDTNGNANNWYTMHVVRNHNTDVAYYTDAVSGDVDAMTNGDSSNTETIIIGRSNDPAQESHLSEIRLRGDALSSDFISTEYSNQSNPTAFWATGTPESTTGGGGGGAQTITVPLTTNTPVVSNPTITVGAVTLSPNLITNTPVTYNPTVSTGGTIIEAGVVAVSPQIPSPNVTPQGVEISPQVLSLSPVVYSPELTTSYEILPELLDENSEVFAPDVALLLQFIELNRIENNVVVYQVTVLGGDRIVIPVADRQTWNRVAKYLRTLSGTFQGNDNDVICAWLRSEGYEDQYNDMWNQYLLGLGYLSSQPDNYANWRKGENPPEWILASGNWDDSGIWDDNAVWID